MKPRKKIYTRKHPQLLRFGVPKEEIRTCKCGVDFHIYWHINNEEMTECGPCDAKRK